VAVDKSNPAGRLYHFFKDAKGLHGGGTKVVLAGLLKVSDYNDIDTITQRLALLRENANEAEQQLSEIQGVSEPFLRPYPKIREAITYWLRAIDKSWDTTTQYVREINIELLEAGADTLSRVGREQAIEEEALASLLRDVNQLIGDVKSSGITPELKNILLKHLQNIREAIELYDVSGMSGIRAAQEAALGAIHTNRELIRAARDEGVIRRVVGFLSDMTTLYGAAELAKEIGETVYRLLQ
jgi:hypothetical protein